MRITEASLHPLRLDLVQPLRTARGTYGAREGFVVRLVDAEGRVGQGEAMPLREFGTEAPEDCARALEALLARLRGRSVELSLDSREERWSEGLPANHPATRHAVEQALLDLLSQRAGRPLCQLLAPGARAEVQVNALLGASTPEGLAEEARRAMAEGYETLKLKVAGRPLAEDVARLQAVRDAVGAQVRLRLDANGGWTEAEAERALAALAVQPLELCEQPVAPEALEALDRVGARAPCPLAVDESLCSPEGVRALLERPPRGVGILVLKPMVLGGLLPALWLAREAAHKGLEAYVTSSLDGVIARAGATHLAAALPSGQYASGLGVGHLFKNEPAEHPFRPVDGGISIPREPGLGVH